MSHHGSCLCQAVAFELVGDPSALFVCHCTRCQKESGSAYATNLFMRQGELVWAKGADQVKTYRVEGTRYVSSFCSTCGSALPTREDNGRIVIPAGSLDTKVQVEPNAHIFWGSRAGWEESLAAAPKFDELPERS